jgi:hypothetical protein
MRITVSHNKGKQEATRIVESAIDQVFNSAFSGAIQISGFQKQWDGPKLTFSMMAGIGPLRAPITGWILPTDTDITINCDLPEFLEKLLPLSVQSNLQSSVRGLLK